MDIGRRVPGSMLPRLRKIKVEGLTRNRVNSYNGMTLLEGPEVNEKFVHFVFCVKFPKFAQTFFRPYRMILARVFLRGVDS